MNLAPPPAGELARIVPPCASTIRRAIASRRPVPPDPWRVVPDSRVNGSKIRSLGGWDTGATVVHVDHRVAAGAPHAHGDGLPGRRVIDGVVDQDQQQLDQAIAVARHRRWRVQVEADAPLRGQRPRTAHGVGGQRRGVERDGRDGQPGLVPCRQLQEVADKAAQAVRLPDDVGEEPVPVARDQALALHHLRVGADEGRGRAQLVGRVRDEPALGLEALPDGTSARPVTT